VGAVNNFYSFPEVIRVTLSVLTVLSAGFTALYFIQREYRVRLGLLRRIDSALSFAVLCQTLINAALIAQVQHNMIDKYIVPSGYIVMRYIIFAVITAVFILHCTIKKPFPPVIAVMASFFTLPIMETWTGRAFPVFFIASVFIYFIGGIGSLYSERKELKATISNLSVQQAMDSLDDAILFYKKNGHILMQNSKMQELMLKMAGRVIYNGRIYFETVVAKNAEQRDAYSFLYHLTDSVWLFTVREINIGGRKTVTRLTAADVTEKNRVNLLLREKHNELKDREKQLKDFVENIEAIRLSEELIRVKTETHDSIGQKLTLLLRYLRYGKLPDQEMLSSILSDLQLDLQKAGTVPDDPQTELDSLISSYGYSGVEINISGKLPSDKDAAGTLVKVLREAVANAVIHGYADRVYANITADDYNVTMRVTDNGAGAVKEIREGGGITGMTWRLAQLGGELIIETAPRFTLTATIPERR